MRVNQIVEERFDDYHKPSMFLSTISCGGKCCIEANLPLSICQNDEWRSRHSFTADDDQVIQRYLLNPITSAIVFGGLEPFEQFDEMHDFIKALRIDYGCLDDVVIYTGYTESELALQIKTLQQYPNIIIKFGRYKPNQSPHLDSVLGVKLISDNQYAVRISEVIHV